MHCVTVLDTFPIGIYGPEVGHARLNHYQQASPLKMSEKKSFGNYFDVRFLVLYIKMRMLILP